MLPWMLILLIVSRYPKVMYLSVLLIIVKQMKAIEAIFVTTLSITSLKVMDLITNGSFRGVKDADRDTYIIAEDYAGNDNDELKLVTAGNERMIVKADGKIGIGMSDPTYYLDVDGDIRVSSNLYIYSNFGINNETPYVTMDVNTTDSIKIPKGNVSQRPVDNSETDESHRGYIRYNTEYHEFEGYGSNNKWEFLGGVKDADRDTYIIAEDYAGNDNDD